MKNQLSKAIQDAISAHKSGDVSRAASGYEDILKIYPNLPLVNHNFGVLKLATGSKDAALELLLKAIEGEPQRTQYWISYINALLKHNFVEEASKTLRKATILIGDDPKLIEFQERIAQQKVLSNEPTNQEFQVCVNLYKAGNLDKAKEHVLKLITQFSESAKLYNLLGIIYRAARLYDKAVETYQEAIKIQPDFGAAYSNWGNVLMDQNAHEQAIKIFDQAIKLNPNDANPFYNKGLALTAISKHKSAQAAYQKSITINPNFAEAHNDLGNCLYAQGMILEAIKCYEHCIDLKSNFAKPYNNLGVALQDINMQAEAVIAYKKAIELEPSYAEAHRHLSQVHQYQRDDLHFLQVTELYEKEDLDDDSRSNLCFALAKMHEDQSNFDLAFKYLRNGNKLRKKVLNYTIEKDALLFSRIEDAQPALNAASLTNVQETNSLVPIFILGMPRSGTTLVEQIISSHSNVTGAGELDYLIKYGSSLSMSTSTPNQTVVAEFRDRYLANISRLSEGKRFVTDKMPQNFLFIPLISAAFPEAKIIHVHRDPRATCWSNYKQYFSQSGLGYSYDIYDCIEYYKMYAKLMDRWNAIYGEKIYNFSYEKLIENPELETKKLIQFTKLGWDKKCLQPQNNKRAVTTASNQQVRRGIYKGSSLSWRRYEPYLNGAFDSIKLLSE